MQTAQSPPSTCVQSQSNRSRGRLGHRKCVRGTGRGRRGRGAARGKRRVRIDEDPSEGWKLRSDNSNSIQMEQKFIENAIGECARRFCLDALSRAKIEMSVRSLPETRSGHIILLADELLNKCREWLNEHIALRCEGVKGVAHHEIYRYLAVLFLSCTGLSCSKTATVLHDAGCSVVDLDRVIFISTHILAYSATDRGDLGSDTWSAHRDRTPALGEFEKGAFGKSRKIFLSPTHTVATLDDDLYGTRTADNQVKSLSSRKADREGHTADAIADAFFRLTLMVRFRRRGETQIKNVLKLVEALLEHRSEQAMSSFTLTADRGYGKMSKLTELQMFGIRSILIMPEHLIRCHPFVAKSYLLPTRNDDEEEAMEAVGCLDPTADVGDGSVRNNTVSDVVGNNGTLTGSLNSTGDHSLEPGASSNENITVPSEVQNAASREVELDRRPEFVIDDAAEEGPKAYFATKRIAITRGSTTTYTQVTAAAVREHGTSKFCRALRFLYNTPETTTKAIETWVAVPRTEPTTHLLFSNKSDNGRISRPERHNEDEKYQIEHILLQRCCVMTVSQRCADWFVLRQFRVTGTMAAKIIMSDNNLRRMLGQEQTINSPTSPAILWDDLSKSWFSNARSTEAMMKGTANESAVYGAIRRKPFVKAAFECGMLARRHKSWLACSPDGVALIDAESLGFENVVNDVATFALASVEIKTCVGANALERALGFSSPNVITCEVGDAKFVELIPEAHVGQIVHQIFVLSVRFSIYVSASETGFLYIVVMRCPEGIMENCEQSMESRGEPAVAWSHEQNPCIPEFASCRLRQKLKSRLPFWTLVNNHVMSRGAFPPLKLFKHGSQSFYSKTKGGVDGTTQARAILRSSTSSLK